MSIIFKYSDDELMIDIKDLNIKNINNEIKTKFQIESFSFNIENKDIDISNYPFCDGDVVNIYDIYTELDICLVDGNIKGAFFVAHQLEPKLKKIFNYCKNEDEFYLNCTRSCVTLYSIINTIKSMNILSDEIMKELMICTLAQLMLHTSIFGNFIDDHLNNMKNMSISPTDTCRIYLDGNIRIINPMSICACMEYIPKLINYGYDVNVISDKYTILLFITNEYMDDNDHILLREVINMIYDIKCFRLIGVNDLSFLELFILYNNDADTAKCMRDRIKFLTDK